jgi:hypothetical protein
VPDVWRQLDSRGDAEARRVLVDEAVIPAKAGIKRGLHCVALDSRLRGNDEVLKSSRLRVSA